MKPGSHAFAWDEGVNVDTLILRFFCYFILRESAGTMIETTSLCELRRNKTVGDRYDKFEAKKNPKRFLLGFGIKRLAASYFHMGKPHTIIGAEQFHFRVRDGIGWFLLAMTTRQTLYDITSKKSNNLMMKYTGHYLLL